MEIIMPLRSFNESRIFFPITSTVVTIWRVGIDLISASWISPSINMRTFPLCNESMRKGSFIFFVISFFVFFFFCFFFFFFFFLFFFFFFCFFFFTVFVFYLFFSFFFL